MWGRIEPLIVGWEDESGLASLERVRGIYSIYYKVPAPMLPGNKYGKTFIPNVHNLEFARAKNHKAGLEYNISINIKNDSEVSTEPTDESLYKTAAQIANHFTQPLYIGMSAECLRKRINQHRRDIRNFIDNLSHYKYSYEFSESDSSEFLEYLHNEYRNGTDKEKKRFKNFGRNLERFYFEQTEIIELEMHLFYFKVFRLPNELAEREIEEVESLLIRTFHPLTNIKYY